MRILAEMRERVRALLFRVREEREMEEEFRFHLAQQTEAHRRKGMSADEARRRALVVFGGVERFKEDVRDARGVSLVENVLRDVRYAARRLLRERGLSVPVVATLGLGIGVIAAVFALVNAVLLRPLPYPQAGRLVAVQHTAPGFGIATGGQSDGTYLYYRAQNRTFEGMGVYLENDVTISDGDNPERVHVALLTPSVFATLGATPALGRLFTPSDAAGGAPRVVVISHDLWVRRYGGDPGAIGRRIELNRWAFEVVGVLPAGFEFPRRGTQVWYPLPVTASAARVRDLHLSGIGRLRPGVSPEQAQADLQRLIPSLGNVYPDATPELLRDGGLRAVVVPLKSAIVERVRAPLVLLLAAAGFLLLIAWANAANIFLVRAERQRRDVAVERALGASAGALGRRMLSESMLLAGLSGALALALVFACVQSRFGFQPSQIPRLHEVRIDAPVVGVTLGLSILSGLFLGVLSLFRAGRAEPASTLKGALGRVTMSREVQHAQRALVTVQVALALALLIGSAVLVQSVWRLSQVTLGFDPASVLTIRLSLPYQPYPTYQDGARFYDELLAQLRAVPGVTRAEAVAQLPLTETPSSLTYALALDPRASGPSGVQPAVTLNLATPGYFEAMRIPLVQGRGFRVGDVTNEAHPVVVSAELARRQFRGASAIGKRVRLADYPRYPEYTIIGVAGSVPGETIRGGPAEMLYFPVLNERAADADGTSTIPLSPGDMALVVRTTLLPSSLLSSVRTLIHELDPKVPVVQVRTMEQIVSASTAHARLTMLLLVLAAGTAIFLGVVGLYAVISYTVRLRTTELGVRIALGASPANVTRMMVRQGVLVALAGVGVGVLAALALTRFLGGLLYEVSATDPVTFAAMAALLLVVTLVASYIPARRAGRIDPVQALKGE